MSVTDIGNHPSAISIDGNKVTITRLTIDSAELAEFVRNQVDADTAVKNVVLMGSAVASFGSTQASVTLMNDQLNSAMGTFTKETDRLFNEEDGEFVAATEQATETIAGLFDPEVRGSVTDKIRETQTDLMNALTRQILDQLSLSNATGPLVALQKNIVESIHAPVEKKLDDVLAQVAELKTEQAVDDANAESFEKSTAKGVVFEKRVEAMLTPITETLSDELADTSTMEGLIKNSKKGDLLVDIDPTVAKDMRITLECKSGSVSKPEVRRQLDAAAENRDAIAAMAVFDSQEHAPTQQPIVLHGRDRMIVALPEENPEVVLNAAYACLRAVALRDVDAVDDQVDTGAIRDGVNELNAIFANLRKINTAHNAIQSGLDAGRAAVTELVEKAKATTQKVSTALDVDDSDQN